MTPVQIAKFIAAIAPAAQASMKLTKIPASFVIAQGALESTWGTSKLATAGFNLFGMKADKSWRGDTITMPTREYDSDKKQFATVLAGWRKYPSWLACIDDHAAFFFSNPRYRPALAQMSDPESFARGIQACGYATDPGYAGKIIAVMKSHDLTRFDKMEKTP